MVDTQQLREWTLYVTFYTVTSKVFTPVSTHGNTGDGSSKRSPVRALVSILPHHHDNKVRK